MLPPDKLPEAFKRVKEENWQFRAFLKRRQSQKLDRLVKEMHQVLFEAMDCISCANCCKTVRPFFGKGDIKDGLCCRALAIGV